MEKPTFMSLVQKASDARAQIEAEMLQVMTVSRFHTILAEYEKLLDVLGNVDGADEMVALVLVATKNVGEREGGRAS